MSETFVVIDASHLGHIALHSVGDLAVGDTATGVLFSFLGRIIQISSRFKTNRFLFTFDGPTEEGVRRAAYPAYKVKRENRRKEESPEEQAARRGMHRQLDLLRTEILPNLGFTNIYYHHQFESDDIIAGLVGVDSDSGVPSRLPTGISEGSNFAIVSSDGDLYQLLGAKNRVFMFSARDHKTYSYDDLRTEYGIAPHQWAIAKAIAGCDTDEVEGIPGVGIPTAIKYLRNELPSHHKTFQAITAGMKLRNRNWQLVALPHKNFPWDQLEVKADNFKGRGAYFKQMCADYAFESFLREPMWSEWKAFFTGTISGSTPIGVVGVRESAHGRVVGPKPRKNTGLGL